jgi:hypothetical protein
VKRTVFMAAAAAAVLLLPAGTAWGRGDGWQKLNNQPVDAACGSTTVHVTFPVDQEYFRDLTLPDGTVDEQITGRLVTKFATDAGASVTYNQSGPADNFTYPNGDFEIRQRGVLGDPGFLLPPGAPDIVDAAGLLDDIIHPDGSITYVNTPHHVIDVCAALGF